jgi:hypothetical protein
MPYRTEVHWCTGTSVSVRSGLVAEYHATVRGQLLRQLADSCTCRSLLQPVLQRTYFLCAMRTAINFYSTPVHLPRSCATAWEGSRAVVHCVSTGPCSSSHPETRTSGACLMVPLTPGCLRRFAIHASRLLMLRNVAHCVIVLLLTKTSCAGAWHNPCMGSVLSSVEAAPEGVGFAVTPVHANMTHREVELKFGIDAPIPCR